MSSGGKPDSEDELAGTEQPFVSHLVELRDRLIRVAIAIGIAFAALAFWPGPSGLYDLLAAPLVAHLPKGATMKAAISVIFSGTRIGEMTFVAIKVAPLGKCATSGAASRS